MNWLQYLLGRQQPNIYDPVKSKQLYTDWRPEGGFGDNEYSARGMAGNELDRKYQQMRGWGAPDNDPWQGRNPEALNGIPQHLLLKLLQMDLDRSLNTSRTLLRVGEDQRNLREQQYLYPQGIWDSIPMPTSGRRM